MKPASSLPLAYSHERYMRLALAYARRHQGMTGENPSVGCAIVCGHELIGVSATSLYGRPHAEVQALAQAGEKAQGATAYVTLEPCAHYGKTPPCAKALIAAGIQQVVIAMRDPFPKVSGKGVAMLKEAGIAVIENILADEAYDINRGFFKRIEKGLPWVSLKLATSLDGKIALANGKSQWITGEKARQYGHYLRARHDAILTGIGTVCADNPMLNCRLGGLEYASPIRVVLDSQLQLSFTSKLVQTASQIPLLVMTSSEHIKKERTLKEKAVKILHIKKNTDGHLNLTHVLRTLADEGVNSVMIEAGGSLSTAFFKEKLIDEIYWFRSNLCLGNDAQPAMGDFALHSLSSCKEWRVFRQQQFGDDLMQILRL